MGDSENTGSSSDLKRSDSRRSPTTGHRRKKNEVTKRSHSMDLRRGSEKLTSSEEELIGKCKEIVEQAKQVQQVRKRTKKRESIPKDDETTDDSTQPPSQDTEKEEPPLPFWKRWFVKKEKKVDTKDEQQMVVYKKKEEPKLIPKIPREPLDLKELIRELRKEFLIYKRRYNNEVIRIKKLRNRCFSELLIMFIFCGCGAFIFKTTEGTFEQFYKCGVKRVKRDFIEELWRGSHFMKEDEWKSKARRKLMDFENQLQDAFEAGMKSYSGQRSWSFVNALLYCLTVVTTIGYGHIAPVTTTGRALTIAYSIIGIPLFLILLADFGKLFTRLIKFVWAFVRRFYYTGTCRKVRRTAPVQLPQDEEDVDDNDLDDDDDDVDTEEVMKGVQIMYDLAHLRRPSQLPPGEDGVIPPTVPTSPSENPPTPALSTFAIDDEFNLPISVAIVILLIYIFLGALVFWYWEEDWTFFESFYFVFISMSTIGFGDLVPQNQMYMMASIVYLAFGLALTSMCINVVQEKLSDTFRQASAKIGATIGLKVCEDDGTVSPVSPTHVEIAEVHRTQNTPTPQSMK